MCTDLAPAVLPAPAAAPAARPRPWNGMLLHDVPRWCLWRSPKQRCASLQSAMLRRGTLVRPSAAQATRLRHASRPVKPREGRAADRPSVRISSRLYRSANKKGSQQPIASLISARVETGGRRAASQEVGKSTAQPDKPPGPHWHTLGFGKIPQKSSCQMQADIRYNRSTSRREKSGRRRRLWVGTSGWKKK